METGAVRAHDRPMDTVNDTDPPTDTPPPYRRQPRLTRATDDKVVGGVAGGLARYFGIDPVVFRIAFVVLALAGGSGILLYLLAWLLVPDDTGKLVLPRAGSERTQKLLTAVLVGGGLLLLVNQFSNRGHGDVPVGVVLLAIGGLVLWSRRDAPGEGRPPSPSDGGAGRYVAAPPPPPPPPPAWRAPTEGTPTAESFGEPALSDSPTVPFAMAPGPETETTATTKTATVKKERPPKPRSVLVPVTLSLLAVLAGGLSLARVSPETGLALALLLTGGALVVGARRGRARWLIPVGLILAVGLAAASIIDVPIRGGSSDATFRPVTIPDIQSPYRLAAGTLRVDLSGLALAGGTVTVVASVAAGHLQVFVPAGVAVDVDAHAGAGNLQLFGQAAGGLDVRRHVVDAGQDGSGRIVLRTRVGAGQVEVRRAAP